MITKWRAYIEKTVVHTQENILVYTNTCLVTVMTARRIHLWCHSEGLGAFTNPKPQPQGHYQPVRVTVHGLIQSFALAVWCRLPSRMIVRTRWATKILQVLSTEQASSHFYIIESA
jgi:hypothetical protein